MSLSPEESAEPVAVLVIYESATTRVFRTQGPAKADAIVCKAYLGAQSTPRWRNERALLTRLAGIEGVVQLAAGAPDAPLLHMADVGGTSLSGLLQAGACEVSLSVSLASQLARTLAMVHRAGIVHRDINPANVLVAGRGRAVLIDFDLGLSIGSDTAGVHDGIVGTLGYLAPEQTGRTGQAVDHRADLYALGATLYEMITGRLPFDVKDTLELIHHHLVLEPLPPSKVNPRVPEMLSAIVMRLLAKSPEHRYQSASGLLHDLARLGAGQDEGAGHEAGAWPEFVLGERDFPLRLDAPPHLVGRRSERESLRSALRRALETHHRTILIEGAPGVGKSALIDDLRPVIAAAGGLMVTGKADQYQRDSVSTGMVIQAMRSLGRLLLAQPRHELEHQSVRILEALGRNTALVTQLLPEFALLLGERSDVPEVDPRLAEARVLQTLLDLLAAIATQHRPLLIVLEDLQWAGSSSLLFFERVMQAPALQGVALIGVYRRATPDASNDLPQALNRWNQHELAPRLLSIQGLSQEGTAELVAEVLRLEPARAAQLGRAVGALTRGNPFDTLEMLNALRADGVLTMGPHGWEWESDAISRFVGRTRVVDLLAVRIGRLPPASRRLLAFMSCLGGSLEHALLQVACGLDAAQLQEYLRPPLDNGLLVAGPAETGAVSFRHDRVQQAALALLDEPGWQRLRLELAGRLAAHPAYQHDAARQYLDCFELLEDSAEQYQVVHLFLGVAQQLAGFANYALAERYLTAARQLLSAVRSRQDLQTDRDWLDPHIAHAVDNALYVAFYSLGRLPEMDALWARLQERTSHPLDLVDAACLRMRSLDMRGQMSDSLALGLQLLGRLGLSLPDGFEDPTATERLEALGEWARVDGLVAHAQRRQITDRRLLGMARLLSRMVRSAYLQSDTQAVRWLLLECQRFWSEHGPCPDLVLSLSRMCLVLIREKQDYRSAYEVSRHVVAVGEALDYEPQTSEARAIFASFACGWFETMEATYQHALRAYEGMRVGGDVSYACYVERASCLILQQIAPTLEQSAAAIEASIALCVSVGNVHAESLHMCERQVVRALRGLTHGGASLDDGQFSEDEFVARKAPMPAVGLTYHARRAHLAMLMGDTERLTLHTTTMQSFLGGEPMDLDVYLPLALASAWHGQQLRKDGAPAAASAQSLHELEQCRAWLAARAADQPYNFLHLLRLVEAEQAYAMGQMWQAAQAFDAAVSLAHLRERPWHRALITERAGLFHVTAGLEGMGRQLLGDALEHYRAWGAHAKVAQMLRVHDFLRLQQAPVADAGQAPRGGIATGHSARGSSGDISSAAVDLMGVLRASQALSSETSVERLTARVTQVLAALSGATKVLVLSWREPHWWLLAPTEHEESVELTQAARRGLLPLSMVAYADRTGEALVVDDAARDDRFARDPYFAGVPICSLLVAPISGQGAARAMLVLESRVSRAAFGVDRLDAVMLIAGQLAVSLANAQLYESLEQRVNARTRELEHMQSQLVTTARRAGKAEIANNVLHNVGNVLNSVNVSASVVRRTISQSRALGLTRAVGLLNEHRQDLPEFLDKDPRGKALLPYLNEVVEALRAEREGVLADLDRLTSSVEHITYVVANQQSHAGPSSVLEDAMAGDLIEEALRLCSELLVRFRVRIERRYEQVPRATLDRQRVLQILVNLIGNAAQAMEGLPQESRLLTISAELVRGSGGRAAAGEDDGPEQLHLAVRDVGEGIAPQNLTRIFSHGFTTRKNGHGFGLHSAALAAMEMGGRLTVHSDGPGQGAVFTLELPLQRASGVAEIRAQ